MAVTPPDLSALFPGFDALQGMTRSASSALPGLSPWVTPTLDPDELGQRIEELKTVQFWLDQNSRMITTTIQAMEVQRMTLSALRTMNVQAQDLAEAFKIRMPQPEAAAPDASRAPAPGPAPEPAAAPKPRRAAAGRSAAKGSKDEPGDPPPTGLIDPMQWWGSLAQQFTQIAAQTLKDHPAASAAADAASRFAAHPAVHSGTPAGIHPGTGPSAAEKTAGAAPARSGARSRAAPGPSDAAPAGRRGGRAGRGPTAR